MPRIDCGHARVFFLLSWVFRWWHFPCGWFIIVWKMFGIFLKWMWHICTCFFCWCFAVVISMKYHTILCDTSVESRRSWINDNDIIWFVIHSTHSMCTEMQKPFELGELPKLKSDINTLIHTDWCTAMIAKHTSCKLQQTRRKFSQYAF